MPLFSRDVLLASGTVCPLNKVSGCFSLLASHLEVPGTRQLIFYLREICLGHEVSEQSKADLRKEALLEEDGTLDPVMKAVVLAALRGEGHNLYPVSPFTTSLDRSLSEFMDARDRIRTEFPGEEAERILTQKDRLPDAVRQYVRRNLQRGEGWVFRMKASDEKRSDPGTPPSP